MKPYLFVFAMLVTPLAQSAVPADPWSLVPALPTACYGKQDNFDEVVEQRLATLADEIKRQDEINSKITRAPSEQLHAGTVDPMEMARRITENMMKDPQNAMKPTQAANESVVPNRQANLEQEKKEREQKAALAGLVARYEATLKAATTDSTSFWGSKGSLAPRGDGVSQSGGAWMHDVGATQNMDAAVAYSKKVDRAYETQVCPQWWKGGPFQTWLAGYRAFLMADIPRQEEAEAKENAPLKLTGVKLEDYRSTLKMKAVKKYLLRIQDVYGRNGNLPDRFVNYYGRWEHSGQPPAQ
jgi:hypothetical protein